MAGKRWQEKKTLPNTVDTSGERKKASGFHGWWNSIKYDQDRGANDWGGGFPNWVEVWRSGVQSEVVALGFLFASCRSICFEIESLIVVEMSCTLNVGFLKPSRTIKTIFFWDKKKSNKKIISKSVSLHHFMCSFWTKFHMKSLLKILNI